jgi:hypothetical protein
MALNTLPTKKQTVNGIRPAPTASPLFHTDGGKVLAGPTTIVKHDFQNEHK